MCQTSRRRRYEYVIAAEAAVSKLHLDTKTPLGHEYGTTPLSVIPAPLLFVIPAKQAVSILCFVATKPQSVIPAKAGIQVG